MRATTYPGLVTLCATVAFGLGACNDNESFASINDPAPVAYKVIAQGAGTGSSSGDEQYRLVESQVELETAFNSVGQRPEAMPPTIDFTQEVAYFATLGSRPSTGYGIAVEGLRHASSSGADDALEVDIKVFSPGPGCANAAVITAPYVIISIAREAVNRGVVNVNRSEKLTRCG